MNRGYNPVFAIATMFSITQILALIAGILLMTTAAYDVNVQSLSVSPFEDSDSPLNAVLMILYVLFGAGAALLVIKYFKTKFVFSSLEFVVVGATVSILTFAFVFGLSSLDFISSSLLSMAFGLSFAFAKYKYPSLKNPAAVLSSAGIAALFGFSLGFWPALLFIIGLSIYDYLAVFKTRHMLTLAQGLGSGDFSFTVSAIDKKQTEQMKQDPTSGVSRLDLGSGDLAVPAILAVSAYPLFGLFGSLAAIVGSILSIVVTLNFVIKHHIILPALPPICIGSLIALLLSQLFVAIL